jgi:hypothetical protein
METITIKNSTDKITPNFIFSEYFNASHVNKDYDICKPLVDAMQILREHYNQSWMITSTYRPTDNFGFHKIHPCGAIDSVPSNPQNRESALADFKQECQNYVDSKGSELIEKLRKVGITGFGIENTCIHLDCRPSGTRRDSLGTFTVFIFNCKYVNGQMVILENYAL